MRVTIHRVLKVLSFVAAAAGVPEAVRAQESPRIRAGALATNLQVDGLLDEQAWAAAQPIDQFLQTDPLEGQPATTKTVVRVIANATSIAIGIVCTDDEPGRIVSYSVRRDAYLDDEDNVKVVIGPFMDGRSGYVFAVNPGGARYDALIDQGDDGENSEWDGIWEASARRTATGWSAEIVIPVQTISFSPDLREWHFNVERKLQRRLETSRWASAARQFEVTQTSRAGILTDLPAFDLGLGLTVRPSISGGGGIPEPDGDIDGELQPSLDVTQRIGSNLLASATFNTDFAETEVDTRRTNLTRFPQFFEEKRTFFLEGSDIFQFGLGLEEDVIPFFSRRIGLVSGREVPIIGGAKLNGRIGNTNIGGLVVGTNDRAGVVPDESLMAVGRVKQNLWSESWLGGIASVGDPFGRSGAWLGGVDFTYATSRFRGDKNLLFGVWGLATGRADLEGDTSAYGATFDYPNDEWEVWFGYKRIGRDFDPSLGFVPRRAVNLLDFEFGNEARLSRGAIQQLSHEVRPSVALDLSGKWESYEVSVSPVNWQFRSGDRLQLNANPEGERLVEPFEVSDGVVIMPGSYHWRRYRAEVETAEKRRLSVQMTANFGGFYDGDLTQFEFEATWNPTALLTVEFESEHNIGDLPGGRFTQTLVANRLRINVSPDLSVASYVQYDTESDSVGVNTRLRWTFTPVADLFVVYNHNVRSLLDRWQRESNQLLIKLQYALRR
jgi:Domain of unknown function (DUF5916)